MNNLGAVKPLYDLGFAILLLHPKSKKPVELGWTTGPRSTWGQLRERHKPGMNVGVRLGAASKLKNGYLACIDVDVKDPKCRGVAEAALARLILDPPDGGSVRFPEVQSGSGNGSRHIYCATAQPFKMITVAKHPGWEICIYSDGRQMVLPPSVHPVTGKKYIWVAEGEIPLMDFSGVKREEPKAPVTSGDFKPEPVALFLTSLPTETVDAILHGAGVSDRSAALLGVCNKMLKAGLTDNEILSVLTDPKNYLGQAGYDHTQSRDRGRAAAWVRKYTLDKSKRETQAQYAFEDEVEETPLTAEEAERQMADLVPEGPPSWQEARAQGFYRHGSKGGRTPLFGALLEAYKDAHPFKTIADMKTVFVFNGTHYEATTPIEVKAFAERSFSPKPEDKLRSEFHYKVLANEVTRRAFFTASTEGRINFKNGVLDLSDASGGLLPHSAEFGFRGVLPYDFNPGAQCPVFRRWIEGVMLGDAALVRVLQEFMGYVVRGGDYKYHKALWLGGVGRNGKSTFVDMLKALIGVGNFSVISIKSLMNDKFAGADLDGKIANFSEETSPQELSDSGPFKNLTGDGDLFAQKKYGDPYSFRNRAKLIMTYNQIPDLKDLSPGMLSRPLIIPFEKVIKEAEQDREIKKKLAAELPGIFNFALEGWRRLEEQGGFTVSEKSALALKRVREESCPVYQWVEHYVSETGGWEEGEITDTYKPHELHALYCRTDRYSYKLIEFCRRLNSHPLMAKTKRRRTSGIVFEGLKIDI